VGCRHGIQTPPAEAACRSWGSAWFDVAAKPPLGRHILDIAQRQPHLTGWYAGAQGLVGGPSADSRQDQRAAEDA